MCAGGTAVAQPADAPTGGDVVVGHALAAHWCAGCHQVEASPGHARDVPPSFVAVAAMTSTTESSLRAFLQTPHANMPDLKLSQTQIDDLVAYILSLKKG